MNVKQIATIWDHPLPARPLRSARRRRERLLTTGRRPEARLPRFYI
ncbi:hypothetical protein [Halomonas lysinitropha]|uniref:Uncharacterized protein n=1 Tax=Halomonas lysinitropha TaxID=2607506 RepID=A0A5K1I9A5_9GAMM|nr:hypothetical protein [Halomonas lysinitropha]VVZ96668.1 hypothetical protein HALO32_02771 [Halomonas lysinitropha]